MKGKKYKDSKLSPLDYRRNKVSKRQAVASRRKAGDEK
jgi:hypothetical protein